MIIDSTNMISLWLIIIGVLMVGIGLGAFWRTLTELKEDNKALLDKQGKNFGDKE